MVPADPAPVYIPVYITISIDYWTSRSAASAGVGAALVSMSPLQPTVQDLFYLESEDARAAGGGALSW